MRKVAYLYLTNRHAMQNRDAHPAHITYTNIGTSREFLVYSVLWGSVDNSFVCTSVVEMIWDVVFSEKGVTTGWIICARILHVYGKNHTELSLWSAFCILVKPPKKPLFFHWEG